MGISLIIKPIILIINVAGIWLALLVASHRPKGRITFFFTAMVLLIFIWVDFAYLARVVSPIFGLSFIKLAWAITPFFFVLIYVFLKEFLTKKGEYSLLEKALLIFGVINIPVILQTQWIIDSIWLGPDGVLKIFYGPAVWVFFGEVFLLTLLSFYTLFQGYRKTTSPEEKTNIRYLLIGLSFFFIMNGAFNIVCPVFLDTFHLYEFGDYSTIVFLAFIAYTIIKGELFGIKVFLTELLVGAIAVLLFWQAIISVTLFDLLWKVALFLLFLLFGSFLIRSVIQEIKRRDEMQVLYQKVEKLSKGKSEFISIASHQLRTPLATIKGYMSMIIEGTYGNLPPKLLKPMENVYQSNERLIDQVNDLLNLSRLEAGRIKLFKAPASLDSMVEGVISELNINARAKRLQLNLKKATPLLPKITADEEKLRQAVLNIIDNAIKYTQEGEINIEIKRMGQKAQIKISDTGEGIAKDKIGDIFEMFTKARTGVKKHLGGAGIGLYIAKKFIEMHKGRVWVESEGMGKGSTFFIELPLTK